MNISSYFLKPKSQRQKQYEAVRAIAVDKLSISETSKKFGYSLTTIYTLLRDVRAGKVELFPKIIKGHRQRRTTTEIQNKIFNYRNQNLSSPNIVDKLKSEDINISTRTIERILKEAGYQKLRRRTRKELGITKHNTMI